MKTFTEEVLNLIWRAPSDEDEVGKVWLRHGGSTW